MKQALIVAYYFAPHSHSGVQRPLKFAKYLPDFGYQPTVLTCGNMRWNVRDESLLDEVEGSHVDTVRLNAPHFGSLEGPLLSRRLPGRLILKIEAALFEDRADWAMGNLRRAVALARRISAHVVYTTGPPHSVHFMGWYLKRKLGIPWIIDFRDPLSLDPAFRNRRGLDGLVVGMRRSLFRHYEQMWLGEADTALTVSDPMTEDLRAAYPHSRCPVETITNGYDEQDFSRVVPLPGSHDRCTIVYTGKLFGGRNPRVFLEGVRHAIALRPELKGQIEISFVGDYPNHILDMLCAADLKSVVKLAGPAEHSRCLAYQLGADVNLLLVSPIGAGGGRHTLTGKIFEYLRAGRPILALVPEGAAKEFIDRNGLGLTVAPGDSRSVSDALLFLVDRWRNQRLGGYAASEELLPQFERRALTRRLAAILNRCISRPVGGAG